MGSVQLKGKVWGIDRVPNSEHYAMHVGDILVPPENQESYDRTFFISEQDAGRFKVGHEILISLEQPA